MNRPRQSCADHGRRAHATLRAHLKAHGTETFIHYPISAHQHEAYADMGGGAHLVSEQWAGRIFSLPLYPEMDEAVVERVVEVVRAFHP